MTTRALVAGAPRRLLSRLLDSPHLAQVVQALDPRVLGALVRHCGIEDCGEIVALATTEQLTRIFDDDLWRADTAGAEEEFDAERFGLWLEVLAEVGADIAARKLFDMDFDFVAAAISRHIIVLDQEILMSTRAGAEIAYRDDEAFGDPAIESVIESSASHEMGGYTVVARRGGSWDALLGVLTSLEHDHHAYFDRLMKRCGRISTEYVVDNGGLFDVLTADAQILDDIAGEREQRRADEGHITSSQAAAFLTLARRPPESDVPDPVTAGYFRDLDHRTRVQNEKLEEHARAAPPLQALDRQVAEFLTSLEAEVLREPRPALLSAGPDGADDRLPLIRTQLQFLQDHDAGAYSRRTEELAYLANVLVAGCSFQSRRFRAVEAADAVLTTCNLGLEGLGTALPRDFLVGHDLVTVFRAGWRVLYEDVTHFVASRLVDVLSSLECSDSELQAQVSELAVALSAQVKAGTPWREADNLDVIASLDTPSWSILVNLIAECPVVPKGVGVVPAQPLLRVPRDFDFISERRQIAWVAGLVESLPERLVRG